MSPRNMVGIGLTDGEGCERLWSLLRHLIPSLRVSTPYRRRQILTACALMVGEVKHYGLPQSLNRTFKASIRRITKLRGQLRVYCRNLSISLKELRSQSDAMQSYFQNPIVEETEVEFDICVVLNNLIVAKNFGDAMQDENDPTARRIAFQNVRAKIMRETNVCLDLNQDTCEQLRTHLTFLLRKADPPQTERDWIHEDDSPTEKYLLTVRKLPHRDLIRLRSAIRNELMERKLEYGNLKNSGLQGILLSHNS